MKKLFYALFFLSLSARVFAQTLFIANSNAGAAGGTNVYLGSNAISDALAQAVTGDIIYVVPSSVVYNAPALNGKGVTLIGGGFNPEKAGGPVSTIAYIYANANNLRLSGLVIGDIFFPQASSGIMIDKCRVPLIGVGVVDALSNVIIQNCIIGENGGSGAALNFLGSSNVTISNNIIYCLTSSPAAIQGLNGATIENNILIGNFSTRAFDYVYYCDIRNNIFYHAAPTGSSNLTNNDFSNNLSFGATDYTFSTANSNSSTDNIEGLDPLFANLPMTGIFDFSYDVSLQSGSPALGAGVDGADLGVFGGENPFDIYGTPLPVVKSITTPNTVPQGSNMNVQIKATGN